VARLIKIIFADSNKLKEAAEYRLNRILVSDFQFNLFGASRVSPNLVHHRFAALYLQVVLRLRLVQISNGQLRDTLRRQISVNTQALRAFRRCWFSTFELSRLSLRISNFALNSSSWNDFVRTSLFLPDFLQINRRRITCQVIRNVTGCSLRCSSSALRWLLTLQACYWKQICAQFFHAFYLLITPL
jgi:hypothetical protein